jgi:hypothetical protein
MMRTLDLGPERMSCGGLGLRLREEGIADRNLAFPSNVGVG